MIKEVFVTGASGLVGSRFIELYKDRYDFITPHYPEFDLTDPSKVKKLPGDQNPDVVVNFAAHTNVNEAESQRGNKNGDCWKINVEGVKNLVNSIDPKTHFIQISTDMVFPGSKEFPGPYSEDQEPEVNSDKLTWYGFTKAEGERETLKKLGKKATILRLAYPFRAKYDAKIDHVRKALILYKEGKLYPMFGDQHFTITFIDGIALALKAIIDGRKVGVFHASSEDMATPFEVASYVIEKVEGVKDVVKRVSVDEFVRKTGASLVRYPKHGGLKVEKTERELDIKFGTWKEMIDEFVSQL